MADNDAPTTGDVPVEQQLADAVNRGNADKTSADPASGSHGADEQDESQEDEFDAERAKTKIAKANSEAASLRKRLRELEPLAKKAQELEESKKSEAQRLQEAGEKHKSRADAAEQENLRLRVALVKGLTAAQAKRLTGDTEEEIAADADDLIATFGGAKKGSDDAPKSPAKPKQNLRGGSEPDQVFEETDPVKLAAAIPR